MAPPAREARQALLPGMTRVHEGAAHRAGPRVQVFVTAPHGEVGAVGFEFQRNVADRVGVVEAAAGTDGMRGAHDAAAIEGLAGEVLHAGPQHQRQVFPAVADGRFDVLRGEGAARVARAQLHEFPCRVQSVPFDLRGDGVAIRGERAGLDEHARALARGPVEARHHQVQVGGQRVHRDDIDGLRARQQRKSLAGRVRIVDPRPPRLVMAEHAEACPVVEFLEDEFAGGQRHQAQRVSAQVDGRATVARQRLCEPRTVVSQWIDRIAFARQLPRSRSVHVAAPAPWTNGK